MNDVSEKPKKKRISWWNVFLVCCLGSPLLYLGDLYGPHWGGPAVTSPEGRAIIREALAHFFPELAKGTGIRR